MSFTKNDHTFVISAYQESPFLETCIRSLLEQSVRSKIIIATSTPNDFLNQTAQKYELPLYINTGKKGIGEDWNFGYSLAKTRLITIAHQDDTYERKYLQTALQYLNRADHPLIFFSDYMECRGIDCIRSNTNLRLKRLMLMPLRLRWGQKSRWIRRRILSFGNPICCPAVTYVRESLPFPLFDNTYKSNLDWATWERVSKLSGSFVFSSKLLMSHRIYEGSTTSKIIHDDNRRKEDLQILYKFWPEIIAKQIEKLYSKSEKSNSL